MKRIIAFVLLFSCLLTFGAGAKDVNLNFLDVKSASCTSEMTIVIDKPLEILSVLDENGYLDSVNKFIDLRAFIESLADSKIKCDIKVNTSDDNLKGRLAAEFDIFSPAVVNPNLKMDVSAKSGIWMDYDFTGKPKYDMIISLPVFNKYLHITQDDLGEDTLEEAYKPLIDSGILKDSNKKGLELIKKYADIKVSGNTYTLKLSDTATGLYLKEYFEYMMELMPKYEYDFEDDFTDDSDYDFTEPEITDEESDDYEYEEFEDFSDLNPFENIEKVLEKITVIGDEGITVTAVTSPSGKIKSAETVVPIDLNVYKVLLAAEADIPEWLTEANSNIAFTVTTKEEYRNVGSTKNIAFPKLTDENSMTPSQMFDYDDYESYDDYSYKRENFDTWIYAEADSVIEDNGAIYIPFRDVIQNACSYEEFDEETGKPYYTITYNDGWVSFNSDLSDFGTLEFKVGRNDHYYRNGTYLLGAPKLINGRVWVDIKLFEEVFGWEAVNVKWDYVSHLFSVDFSNDEYDY